ncbi:MAG TPA: hypothetical protein VFJ85_02890 [Acidimicrobiales bacterium]|nr:hypothetical protein [Acidimicrobiales bacterium]
MRSTLTTLLEILGASLIVTGIALVSVAAALVVAGIALAALGYLASIPPRRRADDE